MPKRKPGRIQLADAELPQGQEQQQESQTVERLNPADEELSEVFSGFPQNENCIELFRTNQQGGRPMYLEVMMPSAFSFGYVAEKYGGGYYIAKGKYQGGEVEKRSFEIEGDPFPVKRRLAERDPYAPVLPASVAQGRAVEVPHLPENAGMAEMFAAMMGMMQKMIVESRTSEVEMLTKMRMYKELFSRDEGGKTPVHELIGMVKTGIELGQAGGGGDAGGFPWLMVLDKIKEPLTKLADSVYVAVSQQRGGGVPNVPVQAAIERPVSSGTEQQIKPESENMEAIIVMSLRAMLPMLVTGAAQSYKVEGGNAITYCDLMLEQLPEQYYAAAKNWLDKDDCVDVLSKMNPGVAPQRAWFETLRQELRTSLAEELKADGSEPVQPSATPDASTLGTADI